MDIFTKMNNVFRFDVTSDFLKKFWEFWIIICTDRVRFKNKDDKIL